MRSFYDTCISSRFFELRYQNRHFFKLFKLSRFDSWNIERNYYQRRFINQEILVH